MTQDLTAQICAAYAVGESSTAIADRLSLDPQKVRRHLKQGGAQMRPRGGHNAVLVDEFALRQILDEAVFSIEQTADHFGVSVPTISRRMRSLGLSSKKGRGLPMEKNPAWRGGRCLDVDGYVLVKCPDHPYATKAGYVREHRLVMEKELGRYLLPDEVVHHRDEEGSKSDNRPENLQVFQSNADHLRHELTGKRPNYTPEGLQRMRENAQRLNQRRALSSQQAKENGGGA